MQTTVTISRKARLWPEIPDEVVTLPTPPVAPAKQGFLALITSIFGLLGGVIFGAVFALTGSSGSGIFILAFMGISILTGVGSLVTFFIERHNATRDIQLLTSLYEKRIEETTQHLQKLHIQERQARLDLNPPFTPVNVNLPAYQLLRVVPLTQRHYVDQEISLWARRADDPDFLTARIGMGTRPATFQIRGEDHTSITLPTLFDTLNARVNLLQNEYGRVIVPLTIKLDEQSPLAISSRADLPPKQAIAQARTVAQSLVAHLAYHHSPEDVNFIVLAPHSQQQAWKWATLLPNTHLHDIQAASTVGEKLSTVAIGQEAVLEQLPIISRELSRRELLLDDERRVQTSTPLLLPRLVIVVDHFDALHGDLDTPIATSRPGLMDFNQINTSQTTSLNSRPLLTVSPLKRAEMTVALSRGMELGVLVICICANKPEMPATSRVVIDLAAEAASTGGVSAYIRYLQPNPPPVQACQLLDDAPIDAFNYFAAQMQTLRPSQTKRPQIRAQVDVRSLFEPPIDLTTYNPLVLWHEIKQRAGGKITYRIPIGQKMGDETQYLDLLKDGPHGLLIGQTGSGKSELLQTIITSLALSYSPNDINFLLIDYKAGLALEPFSSLPHTIGFLSNVSSTILIQRFITMLRAEAIRRQLLEKAYKPMPRLLIIIDEFAQMVKQTESVLDEIFTITRVGREIGMHLLLAAQRPEGVIGSKVRDYVQYRISLRVSSAEDSREVLGRVDAANLPASIPGRGYLLHGDNQLELFQAARATITSKE